MCGLGAVLIIAAALHDFGGWRMRIFIYREPGMFVLMDYDPDKPAETGEIQS